MKLGLAMESDKADTHVSVTGVPDKMHTDKSSKYTGKRLAVGVVIGLIALATVSGIVLASVYFGSKITSDSYKQVRQTFKTDDGRVVEEETVVTDTEVDIKIPNQAEFIYDYKHGLVVHRFTEMNSGQQSACYARFINESLAPSTDKDRYTDGEVTLRKQGEGEEEDKIQWTMTEREVPDYMVSENVAKMCQGTKIYWMEKVHDSGLTKRQATCNDVYVYYTYYLPTAVPCVYEKFTAVFCCDTIGCTYLYTLIYPYYYCDTTCEPSCV